MKKHEKINRNLKNKLITLKNHQCVELILKNTVNHQTNVLILNIVNINIV